MSGLLDDLDPSPGVAPAGSGLLGDLGPGAPSSDTLDAQAHDEYVQLLRSRGRRMREGHDRELAERGRPPGERGGPGGPGFASYTGPLPDEARIRNALALDEGLPSTLPRRGLAGSAWAGMAGPVRQAWAGDQTMVNTLADEAADFAPPTTPEKLAGMAGGLPAVLGTLALSRGRVAPALLPRLPAAMAIPAEAGGLNYAMGLRDPSITPQENVVNSLLEALTTRAGGAIEPFMGKVPLRQAPKAAAGEFIEEAAAGGSQNLASQVLGAQRERDRSAPIDWSAVGDDAWMGGTLGSLASGASSGAQALIRPAPAPRLPGTQWQSTPPGAAPAPAGPLPGAPSGRPLDIDPQEAADLDALWDYAGANTANPLHSLDTRRQAPLTPADEAALRIPDPSRNFGNILNPDLSDAPVTSDPLDARLYEDGTLSASARMDTTQGDTSIDITPRMQDPGDTATRIAPPLTLSPRFDEADTQLMPVVPDVAEHARQRDLSAARGDLEQLRGRVGAFERETAAPAPLTITEQARLDHANDQAALSLADMRAEGQADVAVEAERNDASFDPIDAVREAGGIAPPTKQSGGEYDEWKALPPVVRRMTLRNRKSTAERAHQAKVDAGQAKRLEGLPVDVMASNLAAQGIGDGTPTTLSRLLGEAHRERVRRTSKPLPAADREAGYRAGVPAKRADLPPPTRNVGKTGVHETLTALREQLARAEARLQALEKPSVPVPTTTPPNVPRSTKPAPEAPNAGRGPASAPVGSAAAPTASVPVPGGPSVVAPVGQASAAPAPAPAAAPVQRPAPPAPPAETVPPPAKAAPVAEHDAKAAAKRKDLNDQMAKARQMPASEGQARQVEYIAKQQKAHGMQAAAERRALVQGDNFDPIDGGLTGTELADAKQRAGAFESGRRVTVAGRQGTVTGMGAAFGRHEVKWDDGTTSRVPHADLLRENPARTTIPGAQPRPAPVAKTAAPPPVEPPSAQPAAASAPAPKSVKVNSVADLHRGLVEVYGLTADEATVAVALAQARARSLGEDPDAFVARTISEVREGTSKELKKADATDQGASLFAEDGRAALVALTKPDVSTAIHELGHIFRRTMSERDQRIAGMWAGAKKQADGSFVWGRAAEEKFARGWERYARDGVAPTPELRSIFKQMSDWLRGIYQTITKGSPLDVKLSPEIRALFDSLLTPAKSQAPVVKQPAKPAPEIASEATAPAKAQAPPAATDQPATERTGNDTGQDQGGNAGGDPAPAPVTKPVVGRPDLANPAESDAARKAVDQLDEAGKAKSKEVRHEDEVTAAADAIMGDAAQRDALTARIKAGDTLNDAETMAAKRIVEQQVSAAIKADSPSAWNDAAALHAGYRQGGSEQARAFAMRHDTKQTPAERMRGLVLDATMTPPRHLDVALQKARKRLREVGKGADRAALQRVVDHASTAIEKHLADVRQELKRQGVDLLYQGDNPAILASQVNAALSTSATWSDARHEWYTASIMSAPRTIIVNLAGTPIHAAWKGIANRTIEAAINLLPIIGRKRTAAEFKDVGSVLAGIFSASNLRGAVADGFLSLKYERPVFMGNVVPQDGEQRGPALTGALVKGWRSGLLKTTAQAVLDTAGYFPRAVFGAQRAGDQFWKSWIARVEVAIEASKIGRSRGYEGDELAGLVRDQIDDLDSESWATASASAKEFAFQDEGGELRQKAIHAGNWVRNLGAGGHRPILYLIPFLNTPLAIKFGAVQASPLGTLRMAAKWINHMQGREIYSQDQVLKDAAQQLVGWGVFAAIAAMAWDDDEEGRPALTGTGDFGGGEQAMLDRNRVPSKSVRLFGKYYNYSGVEPLASILAAGVDLTRTAKDAQVAEDPGKALAGASKAALSQLTDSTYLKGLADLRDAMSTDTRDDSKRMKLATNFAVSWIPNLIRQPLRSIDNAKRDAANYGKGTDWWWRAGQNLTGKVIPWADSPQIGVWGKELTKTDDFSSTDLLMRLMGAETVSGKGNLYDQALMHWNNDPRNKTFLPMPPDRSYRDGERTIYWTDTQYRQLAIRSGTYALERLQDIDINAKRPTQADMDEIRKALEKGRAQARTEMRAETRE